MAPTTVERILKAGAVIDASLEVSGEERWTVQGFSTDGQSIRVVAVPLEHEVQVTIVTVIA